MDDWMKLIRPTQLQQLIINHEEQLPLRGTSREKSYKPVVKLHIPDTMCVWLLTECDNEGMAFGLCQIQCAELGNVWLPEVADLDIQGLKVVEDTEFQARLTITQYANIARQNGGLLVL